jgi:uncharacterized protein with PQ loop repeat
MRHVTHHHKRLKQISKSPRLDGLALIVGVLQPVMTIPQVFMILDQKDASQISFWTWFTYDVASVIMLAYGLRHRLIPIVVAQILWLLVQTAILILIFIY